MRSKIQLFADGGVISRNPSSLGGTWCWIAVRKNTEIGRGSGIITPRLVGMDEITNNFTEMYAAYKALSDMNAGWDGRFYTDSLVTCQRLSGGRKWNGIPPWLRNCVTEVGEHLGKYKIIHLKGHPNISELYAGETETGTLTSVWNIYCDAECRRLAVDFQAGRAE
jgi:ribonuclease HI